MALFPHFQMNLSACYVGYHEKGNDGLYLEKDNLVLIEMALAGFHIKLVIIFLFITYKQIKQTKFKAG